VAYRSQLRRSRVEFGLTQAELALAAGVSRQLVAAVEAGVNTPAVDAGLRLARALDCSVEELFSAEELFGLKADNRRTDRGDAASRPELHDGPLVVAGCDPALAVAEAMLATAGPASLLALDGTSGTALQALRGGTIHAAVVHGPAGRLPCPPTDVIRLHLARWQVGLGIASGLSASSLTTCLQQSVPVVQRQDTAASQHALRRAVRALGQTLPRGLVACGHGDAARAAAGLRCAAITTESAALRNGLRFEPLEVHTVEIWLERRWESHPGFGALGAVLSGRAFFDRISQLGGYDLSGCGSVLPVTPPV
jgi:DNA-binding XRE family transcriptional regulator